MQHAARALLCFCFLIAVPVRPGVGEAQVAQDTAPADDHHPSSPALAKQEPETGRFGLGIKMGMSLAQLIGKDAPSAVNEHTDKPEITLGINGRFGLSEWLSLQPELLFISKGRRDNRDGMLLGTVDLAYLEIPFLARITIPVSEQVAPYLLAGPALGFLLRFQIATESDGSVTDRTDEARRLDVSGVLGAGVAIALTPRHGLTLEARYDRSFTRILESGDDVKNRVFAFMLGYQYSLAPAVESTP